MILGARESYDLFLRMGKLPAQTHPEKRRQIEREGLLLALPAPVKNQDHILHELSRTDKDVLRELENLGLKARTYSSVVGDAKLRRERRNLKCQVVDFSLPDKSILRVTENIYMLNPALCLLLLARQSQLNDIEVMFAAFQLCARYAYATGASHELIERIPHTNVARITQYLAAIKQSSNRRAPKGMRRLERIMKRVHDGARSPREVGTDMLMRCPLRQGNLHFPEFETNKVIELTKQEQRELGKQYLESDFVWEKQHMILEYNGGVHEDQREPDSARTNVLRDKGYTVEILTKRIFDNYESLLKFMKRFEKPLGFRIPRDANSSMQQKLLHWQIVDLANNGGRLL